MGTGGLVEAVLGVPGSCFGGQPHQPACLCLPCRRRGNGCGGGGLPALRCLHLLCWHDRGVGGRAGGVPLWHPSAAVASGRRGRVGPHRPRAAWPPAQPHPGGAGGGRAAEAERASRAPGMAAWHCCSLAPACASHHPADNTCRCAAHLRSLPAFQAVAKRSSTPIAVVLVHGGPLDVEWLQRSPRVAAILTAWMPGQASARACACACACDAVRAAACDPPQPACSPAPAMQGGEAVADVLFGDLSPAGRLPITFYFQNYTAQSDFAEMSMRRWPGRTHRYLQARGDARAWLLLLACAAHPALLPCPCRCLRCTLSGTASPIPPLPTLAWRLQQHGELH